MDVKSIAGVEGVLKKLVNNSLMPVRSSDISSVIIEKKRQGKRIKTIEFIDLRKLQNILGLIMMTF